MNEGTDGLRTAVAAFLAECPRHRRRSPGHRHYNSLTRDSLRVAREVDCARECGRAGYCRSFSFRRRDGGRPGEDNCALSAVDSADIDDRADLVSDADWDVFEYSEGDGGCSSSGENGNFLEITKGEMRAHLMSHRVISHTSFSLRLLQNGTLWLPLLRIAHPRHEVG